MSVVGGGMSRQEKESWFPSGDAYASSCQLLPLITIAERSAEEQQAMSSFICFMYESQFWCGDADAEVAMAELAVYFLKTSEEGSAEKQREKSSFICFMQGSHH